MTYKETLFFIGKCLTINHEEHNKKIVESLLKEDAIDWDNVVKVSTAHYVFPALFCNLKRADFLDYLPQDLMEYMQHITDLNRERNQQIIEQAKEINELLLSHNITPIFLKGTGNLLEGLYYDIAERMVGDIDFLVSDEEFKKSIEILKSNGYSEFHKDRFDTTKFNRHYPKMIKENRIASIEVHYKMVSDKQFSFFNYNFISKSLKKQNNFFSLSDENKIIMTSINRLFNDLGKATMSFNLRSSYDLFILSQSTSPLNSIKKGLHFQDLNLFLFSSYKVLGSPKSIDFIENQSTIAFYNKQIYFLLNPEQSKNIEKRTKFKNIFKYRATLLFKSLFNKKMRKYIIQKIKSNF